MSPLFAASDRARPTLLRPLRVYSLALALLPPGAAVEEARRAREQSSALARTPFAVAPRLFDASQRANLGLPVAPGSETVTIFSPTDATDHFSNGVVMTAFKGHLYAQWQSSQTDEDAPDTWIAYSRSADGKTWTKPMVLVPRGTDEIRTSGGFWVHDETLVAYVNVWPANAEPRGGHAEFVTSVDGIRWTPRQRVTMADGGPLNGIFEQDPRALPSGRILSAAHFQPGLIAAPCYTDDASGVRDWRRSAFENLVHSGTMSREIEPSWYRRADGILVMVFRDQSGTFRKLASISLDDGATWSTPVVTNMPDSRSKQSAGNLPDGTAYLVGNPVGDKQRHPLVVALSRSGERFDRAFVLRKGDAELPPRRYPGRAKTLGYSYPKSFVEGDSLYVAYTTNKEDVQFTRVPLKSLTFPTAASGR